MGVVAVYGALLKLITGSSLFVTLVGLTYLLKYGWTSVLNFVALFSRDAGRRQRALELRRLDSRQPDEASSGRRRPEDPPSTD